MALTDGDKAWIENLFLKGVWRAIGEHETRCVKLRLWQVAAIVLAGGAGGGGIVTLFSALGG